MEADDPTNRPCRSCGAPYRWPLCSACLAGDHRGPQRAKAAKQCKRYFTKYRSWTDEDGISRPASAHPLYNTWKHMRARCTNPRHARYADYGGRGIRLHGEWAEDPVAFFEWVKQNLGQRPGGVSLDRICNDGNYEPGNLKWSDAKEQANNRRSTKPEAPELCLCQYPMDCEGGTACALVALPWESARAALEQAPGMWPEGSAVAEKGSSPFEGFDEWPW